MRPVRSGTAYHYDSSCMPSKWMFQPRDGLFIGIGAALGALCFKLWRSGSSRNTWGSDPKVIDGKQVVSDHGDSFI